MKIGTRISADWLERPGDLAFLKQIGVDVVDITMDLIPGFSKNHRLTREGVQQAADILDTAGLSIERINSVGAQTMNTFLGHEGSEQELDDLANNAEISGEFGFPVYGVQCFQASTFGHFPKPMHEYVEGRGGYRHLRVNVTEAQGHPPPEGAPTAEQIWERTIRIFETVVPICESHGINVAMHGNDPPVPELYGVPQILCDYDAFDRLFTAVPSDHNGMTFCVGTRYESGQDVFEGIRRFGSKIFHVHFRNVHGTIPKDGWYEEHIPDAGDLNMFEVASALHEVGYEGTIDYDHIMTLSSDDEYGRQYIAYCVGHMRGILNALSAN
ncbi:MAG: mannonate dehydratase [Candidatus Latescibacterota bacterium]|nr:mannonate dehydratase [Candidatus Latescibacterota bacterium]